MSPDVESLSIKVERLQRENARLKRFAVSVLVVHLLLAEDQREGFVRIRYFALLANRHRNPSLNLCREYLQASSPLQASNASSNSSIANLCQHCRRGMAPAYPACSDYFSRGGSVCRWPNSSLDMNFIASKTGSPRATP